MITIKLTLDEPGKPRSTWSYKGGREAWAEATMDKEIEYFKDRGFHVMTRDSEFCRMTKSEMNGTAASVLEIKVE